MLRVLLLALPLAAGMCSMDSADAPEPPSAASDIPSTSDDAPSFFPEDGEDTPDEPPAFFPDEDEESSSDPYAGSPAVGTWELIRIDGDSPSQVAVITWTFKADGTGVYAQDIRMSALNAGDGSRPFRWQPSAGGAYIPGDGARFVPNGEGRMVWRGAGNGGEDYHVARW